MAATLKIEKLSDSNYFTWKRQMKALLVEKGPAVRVLLLEQLGERSCMVFRVFRFFFRVLGFRV